MALQQNSTLPPAQPAYVLRGHNAQIHSVCFMRQNTRLLTGDADGWLVLWNLASKRPVAVWKGHNGSILGLSSWTFDKFITHGRDSKLLVWQLAEKDEPAFSVVLPIEDPNTKRHEPWLLHTFTVNTINFCSLSACEVASSVAELLPINDKDTTLLVSVPGVHDGDVDIHCLPSKQRLPSMRAPKTVKIGMVMCTKMFIQKDQIIIIAGYESGHVCLSRLDYASKKWDLISTTKPHTQPILSLDVGLSLQHYYTSSADDIIASHSLASATISETIKQVHTKHSGQQSLNVRSDGKILATAGWDGRMRVYSAKNLKELAVLKWHQQGCYALAFADVDIINGTSEARSEGEEQAAEKQVTSNTFQTIDQKRNLKAQTTHWLAAGSKDGKVSLWDIY